MIIIIAIILLAAIAVIGVWARNEPVLKDCGKSDIEKIFCKMASYCYHTLQRDNGRWNQIWARIFAKEQIMMDLKALEPGRAVGELQEKYYVKKLGLLFFLITVGCFLTVMIGISQLVNQPVRDGYYIDRYSFGEGERELVLTADMDTEGVEEMTVTIPEQHYTTEELEIFYDNMLPELESMILGSNASAEYINRDLVFVSGIAGYPFQLKYDLDSYEYIDSKGNLLDKPQDVSKEEQIAWESALEQGVVTHITVKVSCQSFLREYSIPVRVFAKDRTRQEIIREKLAELLQESDLETQTKTYIALPQEVENQPIIWQAKRSNFPAIFFGVIWLAVIVLYYGKDKDLHDMVKKREQQMLADYPEIISKITLLTGAGMTVRNTFYKIVGDYQEKRKQGYPLHFAYEEMLLAVYEMESGVSEIQAYENFGKRCRLQQYTKFAALLSQNIRKSSSGIFTVLQEESREAFEIRKSIAKKMGEEAGTKMLFPMMLMLGIVMIIIFYPAFASYS